MQGDTVPVALSTQFFDAGSAQARALLERFRGAAAPAADSTAPVAPVAGATGDGGDKR